MKTESTHVRVSFNTRNILRALQDQWAADSIEQVLTWILFNADLEVLTAQRNRAIMGVTTEESENDASD
jgi:hypothetical protein